MYSKTARKIAAIALAFVLGVGVGAGSILAGLQRVILVDAHSGDLREQWVLWSFVMRDDDLPPTGFEVIPVAASAYSMNAEWLVAYRSWVYSGVSPSTVGGQVLSAMVDLSSVVHVIGIDAASRLKGELLAKIQEDQPLIAVEEFNADLDEVSRQRRNAPNEEKSPDDSLQGKGRL